MLNEATKLTKLTKTGHTNQIYSQAASFIKSLGCQALGEKVSEKAWDAKLIVKIPQALGEKVS